MEQRISQFLQNYVAEVYFPDIRVTDIVEILFLTFLIYQLMIWIKNTKAWMLLKGIGVLAVVIFAAAISSRWTSNTFHSASFCLNKICSCTPY